MFKKKSIFLVPVIVVFLYAGVVGLFFINEDSFVYFPKKGLRSADGLDMRIETVTYTAADSVVLVGWIVPAQKPDSSTLWLLYFHGNGGNISSPGYIAHFRTFQQMNLNTFAVDYRGYGLSDGSPSEHGLYLDASAAFDYLVHVRHVPPRNIILFGYSLGSAVAIDLATKVDAGGIILEGAFESIPSIGQDHYPFLPVRAIARNRFDSFSKITHVTEPKLFLHAVQDEVVPFEQGRSLFERADNPKTFVETAGGHNTAHTDDSTKFYSAITVFLQQIQHSATMESR